MNVDGWNVKPARDLSETEARERLASGLEASADMLERSQWSQAPHIQEAIVERRMRARVIRRARETEWYRSLSPDAEARAIEDGELCRDCSQNCADTCCVKCKRWERP
jgi:hypothetical protein